MWFYHIAGFFVLFFFVTVIVVLYLKKKQFKTVVVNSFPFSTWVLSSKGLVVFAFLNKSCFSDVK